MKLCSLSLIKAQRFILCFYLYLFGHYLSDAQHTQLVFCVFLKLRHINGILVFDGETAVFLAQLPKLGSQLKVHIVLPYKLHPLKQREYKQHCTRTREDKQRRRRYEPSKSCRCFFALIAPLNFAAVFAL